MSSEMWILDRAVEGTDAVTWRPSLRNKVLVHLSARVRASLYRGLVPMFEIESH